MSALSNKSFSQYQCVEAALPFSAVAQRLQNSNILHNAQIDLQTHVFCGWKLISDQCIVKDITERE
ncbi:hypothetical protein IMSAGC007_03454 [Lachnospiraceae bacterium]|nr:hypothetical protein IMSAGC007_03454 [Lachnospiraceae bacterium]